MFGWMLRLTDKKPSVTQEKAPLSPLDINTNKLVYLLEHTAELRQEMQNKGLSVSFAPMPWNYRIDVHVMSEYGARLMTEDYNKFFDAVRAAGADVGIEKSRDDHPISENYPVIDKDQHQVLVMFY